VTSWSARPRAISILLGLTAVGVVLVLVGWLLLPSLGGDDDDTAARNQVTARANDFAVAYNTYDVAKVDDYQKRLKGLLTPKYDKQFVQITNAVFDALETKDQKSGDAKVLGVAIDSIDKDSAETIVAVDASITNTDNKAAVLRHFRWKVSFVKSKGEWLVDKFESVAPVEAQAQSSTATPTPKGDAK
jgi:Mce-associated membrane protein